MADPTGRIPGYDLAPPTETELRLTLQRHLGRERADEVWESACRAVGVRRAGRTLLPADLWPFAEWLVAQGGVLQVVGRSLSIRLRTYQLLSRGSGPGAR